jgi:hypothetical protein
MSPHDSATKKAQSPTEIYDELSQDEQDTFDRIAATGFKPEPSGRGWKAVNANGDTIGPCPTLSELETETVDEPVAENSTSDEDEKEETDDVETEDETPGGKLHKIAADSRGNQFLPGQEPIVDSEIAAAAGKYHAIKIDRCNLTTKEVAAKEDLIDICHRKKHLFKADPENTNAKIYKVGDLVVRIQNEFKEKVTTEVAET